ncbi:MAG: hypothetical protein IPJ82_06690 [Lewinellaceae bacterium]|nr:hypothetical protein [Lewinellaceae bacterium]
MLRLRCLLLLLAIARFNTFVVGQNDKQVLGDPVLTPAEIAAGTSILYLIRFQNVGNDTAHQVVVSDTLDPRLDPETFDVISASHDYQLLGDGGSFIRWYFEDIQLPDSLSGGSNSIGYILFSINPRPFLAPGQTILNHACISFDQNPVICTNNTVVLIDDNAGTENYEEKKNTFQIVPNPNYGQFEVRADAGQSTTTSTPTNWWITDMNGKTVWNGTADAVTDVGKQVMLEKPSPGFYLLWMKSKNLIQVERFTVIH